jgi:uncharacterized membrane protein YphA (DoxX/SURF4 family)
MLSKINFLLRLIVAIIFLQSLFFKFSGHAEAVHIFTTLGVEPWGRIVLGCIELIIGIALLVPKTKTIATLAAMCVLAGALFSHLFTKLGIVVKWDGNSDKGQLFLMALIALLMCLMSLILDRKIKKENL